METNAMRITVTVRHTELPDELRERAVELVEKATSLAHRPQHAEVMFDADHGKRVVEIHFTQTGGGVRVAHAEADDFRSALDAAVQKLRSQFDKNSGRPRRIPS
jgi:ribosome-associated translation inhibitor RaiA